MNKHAFGRRLKQARLQQNYTSDMLAEACNINAVFVRQIESGTKLPSLSNLILLCNALQTSPAYLLKEDLKINEDEQLNQLIQQMKALSPKQLEVIIPTINTLIDHIE